MSNEDDPEVTDEWVTRELCIGECEKLVDHVYVEWQNRGHFVTVECTGCMDVREIQDDGR